MQKSERGGGTDDELQFSTQPSERMFVHLVLQLARQGL